MSLRIVFMGTPELAVTSLEALANSGEFELVAAVTQPDRPKGRELKLSPSPVKQLALRLGLMVLQPEKAREHGFQKTLRELRLDLIAVAAFGQLLPQTVLDIPRFGCLNVHTSLLPKYRGAAPIQWAILNGDTETGVTIMKMDAGLDTGAILAQERTPISEQDDARTLHDRLATLGGNLLVRSIGPFVRGEIQPRPQSPDGVTYARKISKKDGLLNWQRPARELWNQVRGLVPWPGAFTYLPGKEPALLKIWQAQIENSGGAPGTILRADREAIVVACGEDSLRILSLQREGARRLTPQQFVAGHPLSAGQRLGSGTDVLD